MEKAENAAVKQLLEKVLKTDDYSAISRMGGLTNRTYKVTVLGEDYVVRIPMSHNVDSLNVAAAAAVAFWELRVK